MTNHLSPDECLSAADGTLDRVRRHHADDCETCRQQVDAARAFLAELSAADVPEPSPLFWDHFSARVRAATEDLAVGPVVPVARWRAWAPLCGLAAAAVFAVWLVRLPVMPPVSDAVDVASVADPFQENPAAAWESVMALAADWSAEDLQAVTADTESTLLIEDLTPGERAAFVSLLQQEMGVAQ